MNNKNNNKGLQTSKEEGQTYHTKLGSRNVV